MTNETVVFGFQDFWPKIYAQYRPAFDGVARDSKLAVEMFNAAHIKISGRVELAVYLLVSLTATGLHELLILAGNGAGMGAMKISRGMFESAVMAEYLRQNPSEVDDYIEYGRVLAWKRVQQYPEGFTPERFKQIEHDYSRVKQRFADKHGKLRSQWNKHPISYMASAIGREKQYELPYSLAASMHHANFEAMVSHIEGNESKLSIVDLPTTAWVLQALISGHVYLLQALDTLNDCLSLGFEGRLEAANAEFQDVWKNRLRGAV